MAYNYVQNTNRKPLKGYQLVTLFLYTCPLVAKVFAKTDQQKLFSNFRTVGHKYKKKH